MSADLHFMSIAEAARLISAGKLSPVDYTQALLDRITAFDSQINAFITVTAGHALEQARRAEAEIASGQYRGPLHGIPFGLKDIFDTAGILTSGHSKLGVGRIPAHDATAVEKLYRSGAVLLGKLATHEFAHGGPSFDLPWPPARNPWNPAHFTGSSSTGSGAAVAAGFVPCALGSDTGGSIRIPAGLCGVAGLKPTYGLVSRHGVIPNSFSFDHCGPLAWTVEDCAIVLQTIAGYDARDPASAAREPRDYSLDLNAGVRGLRIGVLRHFWEEDARIHDELRAAMHHALDVLGGLGAALVDLRLRPLQQYYDVKTIVAEAEIFAVHQSNLAQRADDFGADFLGRTLGACLFSSADYVDAQRARRKMLEEFDRVYERCDVLVTVGGGPAARLDEQAGQGYAQKWQKPTVYTPFSVSGGPALSVCIGFSANGMPLSMQVAGRPFDDATVLRVGHAYEQATAWRQRRPELVPGAARVPVTPKAKPAEASATDAGMRAWVELAAAQAGLRLSDAQLAQLCGSAPYVLAMAERVRKNPQPGVDPASVFRIDGPAVPVAGHAIG
jgi:aspartyl-tRNA(Asn)/glutamyl-tRNA(Gln) amidotransferase subunit A